MHRNKPQRPRAKQDVKELYRQRKSHEDIRNASQSGPPLASLISFLITGTVLIVCSGTLGHQPAAQVGDMLGFRPPVTPTPAAIEAVQAHLVSGPWTPPGSACMLDIAAMERFRDQLVVLAVRPDGLMLSWAGTATAPAGAGCAKGRLILVSDIDYRQLQITQTNYRHLK